MYRALVSSVTRKKSPNVYESCPKIISLEKLKTLTPLQKLPKNVGNLGKLIVAKGFKSCPKSNKSPNLVTLVAGQLADWSLPIPGIHGMHSVIGKKINGHIFTIGNIL